MKLSDGLVEADAIVYLGKERLMTKGYVVVNVHVKDADHYPEYARLAQDTVAKYGGRYLVRGATPFIVEGAPRLERFVILEFPSLEHARRWYDSDEYRPVRELRFKWADSELFMIEGHEKA